jgi:hypothetical protein
MHPDPVDHLESTVKIVSAFVSRNRASRSDLVDLVRTLQALASGAEKPKPKLIPAVPVSKSVTPDFIISLEDGRRMKIIEAVSDLDWNDPGRLSQEMGFAPRLPVGGAEFHRAAFASGKEDQAWTTDRQ